MRIPSLDGLRAISIIFVLLAHLSGTRHFVKSDVFEIYGNVGVRIFFVISGYLITTLLLKENDRRGTISLRDFYIRRAYRILPAAYAFMLPIIVWQWRALRETSILAAVTYTSNYIHDGNWILGHLWSLSVEEQFYLLWPLTLLLCFRSRRVVLLCAIAAGPPFRIIFWLLWGHRGLEHPFPVVMDALAVGCLLAILRPILDRHATLFASRWLLFAPAVTLLLPLLQFFSNRLYVVLGLTVLHLAIALTLDHVIRRRYALLNAPPVVWLGTMSYSLYLWQQPFLNRQWNYSWTAFPANLLLAFLFGCLSHYCVEKPFLAFRERRKILVSVTEEQSINSKVPVEYVARAG
jgi:peptidoglycan/LPS O-acetylase OafA/YrhL